MNRVGIRKADLILIVSLFVIALIIGSFLFLNRKEGGEAVVLVDGKEIQHLPLNIDTEVVIGDEENYNILVIEDGKAYVSEASCPDKICVNMGKVCYDGETIVCLPNKTVVKIEGGESSELDDVAQ